MVLKEQPILILIENPLLPEIKCLEEKMPVCEGCGASFQDDFEFCPHCGRAKPETPKIEVDVKVSPRNSPYDCPLCGDAMNAQKVTAIVSSGTSKGSQQSTTQGSSGYYSASSGKKVGMDILPARREQAAIPRVIWPLSFLCQTHPKSHHRIPGHQAAGPWVLLGSWS